MPIRKKVIAVHTIEAAINITPLVDVCLVLLIIFLVVTPMLRHGADVALPETKNPQAMPEAPKQWTLTLGPDGALFEGSRLIPSAGRAAALAALHAQDTERRVVIRGDSHLRYAEVRALMAELNTAGFAKVGLVTKRQGGG